MAPLRPILGADDCELALIAIVAIATTTEPIAAPATVAPVAAAPSPELRAVDEAVFAILEHALLTVIPASINAQGLYDARIGVNAECAVAHDEPGILAGEFAQALRNI